MAMSFMHLDLDPTTANTLDGLFSAIADNVPVMPISQCMPVTAPGYAASITVHLWLNSTIFSR